MDSNGLLSPPKSPDPRENANVSVQPAADDTRFQILVAAARLFAERGYDSCTLREIAAAVGIKAGSVYYHFSSKEAILDEVIAMGIRLVTTRLQEVLANLPEDATMKMRLAAAMRTHISIYLLEDSSNSKIFMQVYEHLPPVMKKRSGELRREYANIWHQLVAAGIASGEVRPDLDQKIVVPFLLAALGRALEWFNPQWMNIDAVCDEIIRMQLEGGLCTPHPSAGQN